MTTISTYCKNCNKRLSDISVYDAPFTSDHTCWECADKVEYAEYIKWMESNND